MLHSLVAHKGPADIYGCRKDNLDHQRVARERKLRPILEDLGEYVLVAATQENQTWNRPIGHRTGP